MISAFFAGFALCWLICGVLNAVGYSDFLRSIDERINPVEVVLFVFAGPAMLPFGAGK